MENRAITVETKKKRKNISSCRYPTATSLLWKTVHSFILLIFAPTDGMDGWTEDKECEMWPAHSTLL